jgi:5-deoxy-glucuronate isomerase
VKRHYTQNLQATLRHDIRPEQAGWKYLGFSERVLRTRQTHVANTEGQEIVIVPLTGFGTIEFRGETHAIGRKDLFRELTDVVYLPPRTEFSLTATELFEVAIGSAPAEGTRPARLIRREAMANVIRGDANVKRGVSTLLDSDELAERLTVYEIRTPSGNWSSFPGHRHDTRNSSTYHEETYYYRLNPLDGFALQRIYTRDTDLDVAMTIHNGDLVLVHEGYHPVVNAPGTNSYYLNFLAGDVRKVVAMNDPHYDWVSRQWDGYPIDIPVK